MLRPTCSAPTAPFPVLRFPELPPMHPPPVPARSFPCPATNLPCPSMRPDPIWPPVTPPCGERLSPRSRRAAGALASPNDACNKLDWHDAGLTGILTGPSAKWSWKILSTFERTTTARNARFAGSLLPGASPSHRPSRPTAVPRTASPIAALSDIARGNKEETASSYTPGYLPLSGSAACGVWQFGPAA